MKHFEKNLFDGKSLETLHESLNGLSGTVSNNLFFCETHEDSDCREHRVVLAKSAYALIGVCEAIISRVSESEAEQAKQEMSVRITPIDPFELADRIFAALMR